MDRAAVRAAAIVHGSLTAAALTAGPPRVISDESRLFPCDLAQDRIDIGLAFSGQLACGWRDLGEEVVQSATDKNVLIKRHRPALRYHDSHFTAHFRQPLSEFLSITHRGRQRHELNGVGQPDDHLFPNSTAEA